MVQAVADKRCEKCWLLLMARRRRRNISTRRLYRWNMPLQGKPLHRLYDTESRTDSALVDTDISRYRC